MDGVINLTMLQCFIDVQPVDGAYWTLGKELIFYGIIAILILFKQKKNLPFISALWLSALFVTYFFNNESTLFKVVNLLLIEGYAQMFLFGVCVNYLLDENILQRVCSVFVLVLCVFYQYLFYGLDYTIFFIVAAGLLIIFVLLQLKGFGTSEKALKFSKPIIFISTISYQIYLIHQNVGYACLQLLNKLNINGQWAIIIPIIICTFVAWLIYKFIDLPITLLYKRLEKKKDEMSRKVF